MVEAEQEPKRIQDVGQEYWLRSSENKEEKQGVVGIRTGVERPM